MGTTLDSLGARLTKVVLESPSYFPNINSPVINDWQPSGFLVLHQFKAGASTATPLLLSATQISNPTSLRSIAR